MSTALVHIAEIEVLSWGPEVDIHGSMAHQPDPSVGSGRGRNQRMRGLVRDELEATVTNLCHHHHQGVGRSTVLMEQYLFDQHS